MSEFEKEKTDTIAFRISMLGLALIVCGLSAWSLLADLLRPTAIEFPTDRQLAMSMYSQRDSAVAAAKIAYIRGDLWATAAFAYGGLLLTEGEHVYDTDKMPIERTRALAERAIAWAPHDARLWLLLTATYYWDDLHNKGASAALNDDRLPASLRMCYYTGLNTADLIRGRLFFTLKSQLVQDDEFQEFVRHDIRIAVMHKTEFAPVVAAVYRSAPPLGKQFMEKTLRELDPDMLTSLRSE